MHVLMAGEQDQKSKSRSRGRERPSKRSCGGGDGGSSSGSRGQREEVRASLGDEAPTWAINLGLYQNELSQEVKESVKGEIAVLAGRIDAVETSVATFKETIEALQSRLTALEEANAVPGPSAGRACSAAGSTTASEGDGRPGGSHSEPSRPSLVLGGWPRDTPREDIERVGAELLAEAPIHLREKFGAFRCGRARACVAKATGNARASVHDMWDLIDFLKPLLDASRDDSISARENKTLWIGRAKTNSELQRGWRIADAAVAIKRLCEKLHLPEPPLTSSRPRGEGSGLVWWDSLRVYHLPVGEEKGRFNIQELSKKHEGFTSEALEGEVCQIEQEKKSSF